MSDHLFKKGNNSNPAGRPKGAKGRFKLDASEVFKKHNYDPMLELIKLGQKENLTDRLRMETNAELCQYLYPKLKSVELSAAQKENISLMINCGKETQESALEVMEESQESDV